MAEKDLRVLRGGAAEAAEPAPGSPNQLTIEELAERSGMTVRNIRAHRARGLLPPPEVRGQTGFYGDEHLSRLRLIQEMQADGFNLQAIERLLSGSYGAAEQILGFRRALATPFETERTEIISAEQLGERLGEPDEDDLEQAERIGVLIVLEDGTYEVPSPTLLAAAEEIVARGVPLSAGLALVEELQRHCARAARLFTKLFLDDVWKPFEAAGHPDDQWPAVVEALERLRPQASEVTLAVFQQKMTDAVESAMGHALDRRSKRSRR
jgi:DNA-binding transcriptional MerR regulator